LQALKKRGEKSPAIEEAEGEGTYINAKIKKVGLLRERPFSNGIDGTNGVRREGLPSSFLLRDESYEQRRLFPA